MQLASGRVLLLSVGGGTTPAAFAGGVAALLAADAQSMPLGDLPHRVSSRVAPHLAADDAVMTFDLALEPPAGGGRGGGWAAGGGGGGSIGDEADVEQLSPGRTVVRAVLGLCDASAHDEGQLLQAAREFPAEAARVHRTHGPPVPGDPVARLLIFGAAEHHLEHAGYFGPHCRFVMHAMPVVGGPGKAGAAAGAGGDGAAGGSGGGGGDDDKLQALCLLLRLELSQLYDAVLRRYEEEVVLFTALEEGTPLGEGALPVLDVPAAGAAAAGAGGTGAAGVVGGLVEQAANLGAAAFAASSSSAAAQLLGGSLTPVQLQVIASPRSGRLDVGLTHGVGSVAAAFGSLRRRLSARLHKHRADVLLLMGSPADALEAADRAARGCRATGDSLFAGLAEETRAAALQAQREREQARRGGDADGGADGGTPFLADVAGALRDALAHFDALHASLAAGGAASGGGGGGGALLPASDGDGGAADAAPSGADAASGGQPGGGGDAAGGGAGAHGATHAAGALTSAPGVQAAGAGAAAMLSDLACQLVISARVRLASYLLLCAAPPRRALDALCAVAGAPADGDGALLRWWIEGTAASSGAVVAVAAAARERARADVSLLTLAVAGVPPAPPDPSDVAVVVAAAAAAAFVARRTPVTERGPGSPAPGPPSSPGGAGGPAAAAGSGGGVGAAGQRLGARFLKATATAAAVVAANVKLDRPGGGGGGGSSSVGAGVAVSRDARPSPLEFSELLNAAVARVSALRAPSHQARALLLVADVYECGGLRRKADAAIGRACRVLRQLQTAPSMDSFAPRPGAPAGGCVYTAAAAVAHHAATPFDVHATASAAAAQATPPALAPWPLPWLLPSDGAPAGGAGGPPQLPAGAHNTWYGFAHGGAAAVGAPQSAPPVAGAVPLLAGHGWLRFRPGLAAALLTLSCGMRGGAPAARLAPTSRGGAGSGPTARSSTVTTATTIGDWAPSLVADLWQAGELPLALAAAELCCGADAGGSGALLGGHTGELLRLPQTTAVLRGTLPPPPPLPAIPLMPPPLQRQGSSRSTPPALVPLLPGGVGLAKRVLTSLRTRRALVAAAGAALSDRSPLLLLRTLLCGTTLAARMSLLDAAVALQLLHSIAVDGGAADGTCGCAASAKDGAAPAVAAGHNSSLAGLLARSSSSAASAGAGATGPGRHSSVLVGAGLHAAVQAELCCCGAGATASVPLSAGDVTVGQATLSAASPGEDSGAPWAAGVELWRPAAFVAALAGYLCSSAAGSGGGAAMVPHSPPPSTPVTLALTQHYGGGERAGVAVRRVRAPFLPVPLAGGALRVGSLSWATAGGVLLLEFTSDHAAMAASPGAGAVPPALAERPGAGAPPIVLVDRSFATGAGFRPRGARVIDTSAPATGGTPAPPRRATASADLPFTPAGFGAEAGDCLVLGLTLANRGSAAVSGAVAVLVEALPVLAPDADAPAAPAPDAHAPLHLLSVFTAFFAPARTASCFVVSPLHLPPLPTASAPRLTVRAVGLVFLVGPLMQHVPLALLQAPAPAGGRGAGYAPASDGSVAAPCWHVEVRGGKPVGAQLSRADSAPTQPLLGAGAVPASPARPSSQLRHALLAASAAAGSTGGAVIYGSSWVQPVARAGRRV